MGRRYICDVCGRGATHLNYQTDQGRCERHVRQLPPEERKLFVLIKE